jgi:polar amino acid transport system substrate-binding protein
MKTPVFILMFFLLAAAGSLTSQTLPDYTVLTEDSPPGEYLDKNDRVTGPTAEMVRELMKRLGIKKEIQLLPWIRAYKMAQLGPRTAVFETTRSEERENQFKWVGPIKRIRWTFFGRKNSKITANSLEDLKKLRLIGVYLGDAKGDYLKSKGFTNLFQPPTAVQCVKMLMSDRLDLVFFSDLGTPEVIRDAGYQPDDLVEVFISETRYGYIALSKDSPDEEVRLWQKTLDDMKKDGTFARYYQGTYPDKMIRDLSVPGDPLARTP